jgi:hypothetical protein
MPPRKFRLDPEERIMRAATRMIPGTLAGRAESAAPVHPSEARGAIMTQTPAVLICTFPGAVADSTFGPLFFPTFNASIKQVRACATTAPSGVAAEVDVLVEGVTIFPSSKPTIPVGSLAGTPVALTSASWDAGNKIQCKVIENGSATDIVVAIDITR